MPYDGLRLMALFGALGGSCSFSRSMRTCTRGWLLGTLANTSAGLDVLELSLEGTSDEVSPPALYEQVGFLLPNVRALRSLRPRTSLPTEAGKAARRIPRCGHALLPALSGSWNGGSGYLSLSVYSSVIKFIYIMFSHRAEECGGAMPKVIRAGTRPESGSVTLGSWGGGVSAGSIRELEEEGKHGDGRHVPISLSANRTAYPLPRTRASPPRPAGRGAQAKVLAPTQQMGRREWRGKLLATRATKVWA
ncbi:hypothetical protein EDB83DRAFT_2557111 [Lactarius deliciosus]|nr:hypothetical protein EDB83DRAFT_2557111 [Lactarius deliciosus]